MTTTNAAAHTDACRCLACELTVTLGGPTCGVCGSRFVGSHLAHYTAAHR